MIEHLQVLDTSHWKHPADEWVVRSQTYHHRDAGWMARLVHLPILVQALLPEWQARWRHSLLNVLFPAGHTWIPGSDWF